MEELVKILTKNNEQLLIQNEALTQEIKNLNEQVAYLTKKIFGPSSEKITDKNQLSLFEEAESFNQRRQPKKKPSKKDI